MPTAGKELLPMPHLSIRAYFSYLEHVYHKAHVYLLDPFCYLWVSINVPLIDLINPFLKFKMAFVWFLFNGLYHIQALLFRHPFFKSFQHTPFVMS